LIVVLSVFLQFKIRRMNLGKVISDLRKKKNLTQLELAEKCKMTQAYLSHIENNKKDPHITTLKEISKALEIPLPIIFFLSMDEDDVPDDKKELSSFLFKNFKPILENNYI